MAKKGCLVYAVVRNLKGIIELQKEKNIIIVECNFENYRNMHKMIADNIDVFYHFAWSGVSGKEFKDYDIQLDNIKYGCDALNEAIKIGAKKFVFAGSSHEFKVKRVNQNNKIELRRCCVYGTAKLSCELMCKTLALQGGIEFNSVIFTNVFGVGDKSNRSTNTILKKMLNYEVPKLVVGNDLYDWVYIDDVVKGLCVVGERGVNFKSYYIGNRNLKKLKHIIEEVRDIVVPEMELKFGEFKDDSFIDYSSININELYEDTDYLVNSNFKTDILKTIEWLKK